MTPERISILGIVLYRLTNHNRLPFVNLSKQLITYHDKEEALARRMSGEAFLPPDEADDLLSSVIMKACAYEPENRYQTAEDMLRDLELLNIIRNNEASPGLWATSGASKDRDKGEEVLKDILKEAGQEDFPTHEVENPDKKLPEESTKENPSGNGRSGKNGGFKKALLWISGVVAVGVIVCVFASVYIRRTLVDTVREQAEQMLKTIQNSSEAETDDLSRDLASYINLINRRTKEIVAEQPDDIRVGTDGKVMRYYNDEGELRKVLVYPDQSAEGVYEEYYYWNGEVIFVYIWYGEDEEMYYYRDGLLIRWVDQDGIVHDNEQDNEEFSERGDKYWLNSNLQRE